MTKLYFKVSEDISDEKLLREIIPLRQIRDAQDKT